MSDVHVSQEQAQWLFAEGATLVFLDLPAGSEFGVDYNNWEVGPQFKGVKMIPPGIHFVYFSAVSRQGEVAPRTGFLYNFAAREVLVKVWDPADEDIKSEPASAELQAKMESSKQELDRFLGVYPYGTYKKWISLSDHISPALLDHLQPLNGKICAVTPLLSQSSTTESRRAASAANLASSEAGAASDSAASRSRNSEQDIDCDPRLPYMEPVPGSQIRFSHVPRHAHLGTSPTDITHHGMDRSAMLQTIVELYPSEVGAEEGVLGELQFAFLCFIIGQVYDAFEAWKRLVHLLCSCVDAVSRHPSLYMQFLSILHRHIAEIPDDFFVDIVTRDNFLTGALRTLFENVDAAGSGTSDVKRRAERFRAHLERKFRWDFSAETGEYAPVVVDLSVGTG